MEKLTKSQVQKRLTLARMNQGLSSDKYIIDYKKLRTGDYLVKTYRLNKKHIVSKDFKSKTLSFDKYNFIEGYLCVTFKESGKKKSVLYTPDISIHTATFDEIEGITKEFIVLSCSGKKIAYSSDLRYYTPWKEGCISWTIKDGFLVLEFQDHSRMIYSKKMGGGIHLSPHQNYSSNENFVVVKDSKEPTKVFKATGGESVSFDRSSTISLRSNCFIVTDKISVQIFDEYLKNVSTVRNGSFVEKDGVFTIKI